MLKQHQKGIQFPEKMTRPILLSNIKFEEETFAQSVLRIIESNLENPDFDTIKLASKVHLSISQLNRRLSKSLGCSAGKLIRGYRMDYAACLLTKTIEKSISEVAFAIGYNNLASFCRSFKQEYDYSPSKYREIKMTDYA